MFYFTIGNMSPKYRSQLCNIQLVAIAKSTMISQYGMDEILKPFVNDLKKLVCWYTYICNCIIFIIQEKGVEFCVNGRQKTLYGTLAVVSADNLGSLLLGGFKESCTALRMCRYCMATKEESNTQVWCICLTIQMLLHWVLRF